MGLHLLSRVGFFSIAGVGIWKVGDTQASRILAPSPSGFEGGLAGPVRVMNVGP